MSGFEWVGFFVSLFAVLVLTGRAIYDIFENSKNPSKYQMQKEEAERRFKAFLRGEAPSPTIERVLRQVIDEDLEDDEEEDLGQLETPLVRRFPERILSPQPVSSSSIKEVGGNGSSMRSK